MGDTPQQAEAQYVSHRYERGAKEDGRRCHKWFLVDDAGTEHLAVIGLETDTLDGHYTYQALEPFASRMPLACGNQGAVVKYLREWLGDKAGEMPDCSPYSGTGSAGGGGSGGAQRRKAFSSSLCSNRAAILNAAGASPVHYHSGGAGRGKGRKGGGNQTALAAYSTGPGAKQKAVGIVQQNQIKKARKYQEDIRAEHERLVAAHLSRLRRAAAAELMSDTAAKQVALSWLQGTLTDDELEAVHHWRVMLSTVLDLQDQQQAAAAAPGGSGSNGQQQRKQKGGGGDSSSAAAAAGVQAGAGVPPSLVTLLPWLQSPASRPHHVRVMLECLRELAAADIPARVLLQHKLIALVQRCRCEQQHEAVKSLAGIIVTRWKWQLAGHTQVLVNPVYMEDHVGVLEEEVKAGLVPLPTLPQYKQAVLNTQLPTVPGPGSRNAYTPAYSNQAVQQQQYQQYQLQQQTATGSTPQLYDAAAGGYAASAGLAAEASTAGSDGMFAGFGGFYTPMPSLSAVQLAISPTSGATAAAAVGSGQQQQQQQQHLTLYGPGTVHGHVAQFLQAQQASLAGAAAAAGGMPQHGWHLQGLATGAAATGPSDSNEAAGSGFLPGAPAGVAAMLGQQQAAGGVAVQMQQ